MLVTPPAGPKAARKSYSLTLKSSIVNEAVDSGNIKRTAKKYDVSPKSIRSWKKSVEMFSEALNENTLIPRSRKRFPGGGRRSVILPEIEQQLIQFVDDRRCGDFRVTVRMVIVEWMRIDAENVGNLTRAAINKRIRRLVRRHGWVNRRTTHQAQNTRHSDKVITDWVEYIQGKMDMYGIKREDIANFDETNCYFSPTVSTTLAKKGSRTVSVKKGSSSQRCTVMLGCSMSGEKFVPYIIYGGSDKDSGRIKRELAGITEENSRGGYPFQMKYAVQKKAWMDEERMLDWVERVWKPFTDTRNDRMTMLLLDECTSHMTWRVKDRIISCGTELEFIPAGYTSRLQVMDVGLNKPYKDRVCDQFDQFMVDSADGKPCHQNVATWT
jgi:hypothetical protein